MRLPVIGQCSHVTDRVSRRLELPFLAREVAGIISVVVSANTDPTGLGCGPQAAGFPICEATVSWPLKGYSGLLGWVQLVGITTPSNPDRRFQIDPLQIYEGLDTPFGFYGVEPTLFDGPSRRRSPADARLARAHLLVPVPHPTHGPERPGDRRLHLGLPHPRR